MVLKDTISSIVIFFFSLAAFLLAKDFGGGSDLFPRGISAIMMVVSAIIFLRAVFWRRLIPEGLARMERSDMSRTAISVVLTLIYVALLVPVGFAITSVIYIVTISYILGLRNHLAIWLTALIFVGLLYYLFVTVFHTPLPSGVIFDQL
jgi:hypothetical protein